MGGAVGDVAGPILTGVLLASLTWRGVISAYAVGPLLLVPGRHDQHRTRLAPDAERPECLEHGEHFHSLVRRVFLAAGSVIHSVHSNNMSDMGGLRKYMPQTFWTFLIGSLALAGIFPLAGFWSKDEILAKTFTAGYGDLNHHGSIYYLLWALAEVGRARFESLNSLHRARGSLDETASAIGTGQFEAYRADVSDFAQVESTVAQILQKHGRIDLLFNNAGIAAERLRADGKRPADRSALPKPLLLPHVVDDGFAR